MSQDIPSANWTQTFGDVVKVSRNFTVSAV
jgi:hypothetical protein